MLKYFGGSKVSLCQAAALHRDCSALGCQTYNMYTIGYQPVESLKAKKNLNAAPFSFRLLPCRKAGLRCLPSEPAGRFQLLC
jgi:hypothetical protein